MAVSWGWSWRQLNTSELNTTCRIDDHTSVVRLGNLTNTSVALVPLGLGWGKVVHC